MQDECKGPGRMHCFLFKCSMLDDFETAFSVSAATQMTPTSSTYLAQKEETMAEF